MLVTIFMRTDAYRAQVTIQTEFIATNVLPTAFHMIVLSIILMPPAKKKTFSMDLIVKALSLVNAHQSNKMIPRLMVLV